VWSSDMTGATARGPAARPPRRHGGAASIVEDGILILDRGRFFEEVLSGMRERMRALGSRRVFLEDGSWYWDLKPDFRFGEVVEI
jgi:hypothetical protein